MLSFLEDRQLGNLTPISFTFTETTRRILNQQVCKHEVQGVHDAGLNTLDIDKIEQRYLLSGNSKGGLAIHDLHNSADTGNYKIKAVCKIDRANRYSHSFSVEKVQWYPYDTGMFTSSSTDGKLKVWDSVTMKPADTVNMAKRINCHHMSPSSCNRIAVAMDHPHVVLVDITSGARCHELHGHKGKVKYVQWSPNAPDLLASCGSDNKILLWDVRSAKSFLRALDQHNGEVVTTCKKDVATTAHNGIVNGICFTPDGLFLLSFGSDSCLRLWDVAAGKNTLVNFGNIYNDFQYGIQMDICYNAGIPVAFVPSKGKVTVFELFTGTTVNVLGGHFNYVRCAAYRSFLQELYTGGSDRKILLWTADEKRENMLESTTRTDSMKYENWSD